MTADVAIIVPMLGRPHRVRPLLESIHATTKDVRVVFALTRGDARVKIEVQRSGEVWFELPPNKRGDFAKKFNEGCRKTEEPLIFMGADDLRFHDGWLDAAIAHLADGVGVIGTNDLGNPRVTSGEHATHSLLTREYAAIATVDGKPGPLYEGYLHEYVDDELVGTARKRGAWTFASDSHVEHMHPHWHPEIKMDSSYAAQTLRMRRDRTLFDRRRALWT